jgi:hypothetical protein
MRLQALLMLERLSISTRRIFDHYPEVEYLFAEVNQSQKRVLVFLKALA